MGFLADQEAAIATEYALLIGLIALAAFTAMQTFGSAVFNSLWQVASTLPLGS